MEYEKWEPYYQEILKDTGFSQKDDEESTAFIAQAENALPPEKATEILRKAIRGKTAVICGNAPGLRDETEKIRGIVREDGNPEKPDQEKQGKPDQEKQGKPDQEKQGKPDQENQEKTVSGKDHVIIAADGAAAVLSENGIRPDIIVTDLDGRCEEDVAEEIRLGRTDDRGVSTLLLIHAHGNNRPALEKYLPQSGAFIATCQCRPAGKALNFGGFSDGDRCLFLAEGFDASKIVLFGFDTKDANVTPIKRKKLEWAERLIRVLRNEKPELIPEI
ncbi:MAG: DUF115 domain-containing protein [Methanosarcinaceae archaeon]|nr:DUF115 domain-containing protein [Methanosarcinaceae archaeon]